MSRDDQRTCDKARPAAAESPMPHDAGPGAIPPKAQPVDAARPPLAAIPPDPEMERYRSRLEAELARRGAAPRPAPSQPAVAKKYRLPVLPWLPASLRQETRGLILLLAVVLPAMGGGAWFFHHELVAPVEAASPVALPTDEEPAELRQALQQERDRTAQLSGDLAVAWRELSAQLIALGDKAARDSEVGDLRQALKQAEEIAAAYELLLSQERQRYRTLDEQLAARREAATAGDLAKGQEITGLQQALKRAEERAADGAQSLAAATADKAALEGQLGALQLAARQAAEQATAQEAALTNERRRSRMLEEQLASDRTARERELGMLRQALREAEGREAGHQRLVAQERDRNGQLERELATRQAVLPASDGSAKTAPANTRVSDGAGDGPAPIAAATDLDLSRLMARARVLLVQGDISAARVVLERAAEGGNAPALFALAETFDPAVLSSWGTLGTQGDVAQAQELYARALAGGVTEAKERMGASR